MFVDTETLKQFRPVDSLAGIIDQRELCTEAEIFLLDAAASGRFDLVRFAIHCQDCRVCRQLFHRKLDECIDLFETAPGYLRAMLRFVLGMMLPE